MKDVLSRKPLEEVQQILCDNSLPIEIQSSLKCGQSEHNLRAKRIIKCIPSETNQKITSYFVDRKFSRPSIRKDKFSSLINPIEQPRNCASESILLEPEVPGQHLLVTDPVIENAVNDNSGASQILVSNPTRTGMHGINCQRTDKCLQNFKTTFPPYRGRGRSA